MTAHVCVEQLYALAGYRTAFPPGTGYIALAALGERGIRESSIAGINERGVVTVDSRGRWTLHVNPSCSDEELVMAYARGLARWWTTVRPQWRGCCSLESLAERIAIPDPALAILLGPHNYSVEGAARFMRLPIDVVARRARALSEPATARSGLYAAVR